MESRESIALLAAVVSAIFAAAKLVADKEAKISDFRREWIGSLRGSLSECLAQAHLIAGRIRIRARHGADGLAISDPATKASLEEDLVKHWEAYRRAHCAVMLHLNFSETSVPIHSSSTSNRGTAGHPLEVWKYISSLSNFPAQQLLLEATNPVQIDSGTRANAAAVELVSELDSLLTDLLGDYEKIGEQARYERIDQRIRRSILLGNLVIKPEWDMIKRGEMMHRVAVRGSVALAAIALLTLILSVTQSN